MAKSPREEHPNAYVLELPQYTQFPNEVVDVLMARLTGAEYKVFSYIVRRTLGFQTTRATITVEQICDGHWGKVGQRLDHGTGISRSTVYEVLNSLEKNGYIVRRRNFGQLGETLPSSYTVLAKTAWNEIMYADELPVEPVEISPESVEDWPEIGGPKIGRGEGEGPEIGPPAGPEIGPPIRNRKKEEIKESPVVPFSELPVENRNQVICEICGNDGLISTGGTRLMERGVTVRQWRQAIANGAVCCQCDAGHFVKSLVEMAGKGMGKETRTKNAS